MSNFDKGKSNIFEISNNNEIDLRIIINFLIRNKFSVATYSIIFFIFFCLFSLTLRRVWSGQFQIVVNQESSSSRAIVNKGFGVLENFLDVNKLSGSRSIETEIGILESPSVLMPAYDFHKNELKNRSTKTKKLTFRKWKDKNFNINRQKKTSILNITYKDNEKDLILPVLNRISSIYQEYSGKGQRRNVELSKKYLVDQINIYKIKSSESIRAAQSFAIDKDLTTLDLGNPGVNSFPKFINQLPNNNNNKDYLGDIVSVEVARLRASNKIKNIDIVIQKIEELGNDTEDLQYISLAMPSITSANMEIISDELSEIDADLTKMKSKFTNKYEGIKRLEEERKIMAELFKKRTIGLLKAEKLEAESKLQAATRPKEVLLAYKELIREANRDENTLTQLEDNLRMVSLEGSKIKDPWELITDPTFNELPVGPQRKIIGLFGLLIGAVIGILISFLKEKKTNFIFDPIILESLLDANIIEKIRLNSDEDQLQKSITFIKEVIKNYVVDDTIILTSENLENNIINKFCDKFQFSKEKIINQKNNFSIKEKENILYLLSIRSVTYSEVDNIRQKFKILGKNLAGIILIID